jgi:hypothetical protein
MVVIRSQNKESLGYTCKIGYTDFAAFQRKGHYIIDDDGNNPSYLGEYATKERALEVLDMIQDFINDIESQKLYASAGLMNEQAYNVTGRAVFIMPVE